MQEYLELVTKIGSGVLMIIGGATLIFRVVHPLTEAKWDDKVYRVLCKITKVLEKLSLNKNTKLKI